jgi:hypothetical protein
MYERNAPPPPVVVFSNPTIFGFRTKTPRACKIVDAIWSFFSFGAGVHGKFWSDGGPQFTSDEFNTFLRDWGISNGI